MMPLQTQVILDTLPQFLDWPNAPTTFFYLKNFVLIV
jgi:hypothetical protein